LKNQFFLNGKILSEIAGKTMNAATVHDIAWVFFGASSPNLCFIGITQGLAAMLLLLE